MLGRSPVTRWLARLVSARYLRVIPVEFSRRFYLRVEILGCTGGEEPEPPTTWRTSGASRGPSWSS